MENKVEIAKEVRRNIVKMVYTAKSGHPGGSLSAVEALVSLYFGEMNIDPTQPELEERDRFVLSKGHITPAYYSVLAERGYFPKEELASFRKIDSRLQGHPCMQECPGIDMSTGSLGQGFPVQSEWRLVQSFGIVIIGFIRCLETENWKKARSGRQVCLQDIGS